MSNINEEKNDGLGAGFFKNLKAVREENEQNAQQVREWEQDQGPKPSREMMPNVMDEQGIHDEAKARTQRQAEEQAKLEQVGLAQGSRRSFGEKMEQSKGHDAIEQARTETRQEQELEQKQERDREL